MTETTSTSGPVSITASLLSRVRAQDGDAWSRLTFLYEPVVREWCRRQGVMEEDAADVSQEVFAAVMKGIEKFRRERPEDTFRGWLYGITRFKIADYWRAKEKHPAAAGGSGWRQVCEQVPEPDDLSDALSSQSNSPEVSGLFRRALDLVRGDFAANTFQAFWRTAVEEQPAAAVAQALGMTAGGVYVAKSRVLKRLREELADLERFD